MNEPCPKMPSFKFLIFLSSLFVISLFSLSNGDVAAPTYSYHYCSGTSFTANSTYQSNLNIVLSSLSSNGTRATGFSNASAGEVSALFLCRGDVNTDVCQYCVATATKAILLLCPLQIGAIIWYDECLLRYSNESIFATINEAPGFYSMNTRSILEAEKDRFNGLLGNTMNSLATLASNSLTGKKFATEEEEFNSTSQTLYSLVQCTPDLTVSDCYKCIRGAIGGLPTSCCDGKQGGRILRPSCILRYELYPFYNFTVASPAFPPLPPGISGGVIAGISVAAVAGASILAFSLYAGVYRRKKVVEESFLPAVSEDQYVQHRHGSRSTPEKISEAAAHVGGASPGLPGITVDKSVEFSYEELAKATNVFSLDNKIGQGGFGSVYYAELRGEKAAIKKMDTQASKEFLAELKVLTHVHHLNLVHLIGYCVEGSLFLVYEYIENGNLSQHLRGSEREPLPWSTRVQIALDSARGLEYIHEHTVPVCIHRDIKSANILIDKKFRGKVADFGLAKRTEYGSSSLYTRLAGTFGYMPPEYAQYVHVSPKVDVYAFGVVLYELISAKDAIVKTNELVSESTGLVALFEDVLSQPDTKEDLLKLVDPRLGNNCPLDSVSKMAHLAKACTQENPQLRPSMRSIAVALMTLSSSTEDWDVASFYENQVLVHLMSGR